MHASYKKWNWLKLHSKYVFEVQDCSEWESNLSTKFHEYCTANEVIWYDLPDIITREWIVLEQAWANLGKFIILKLNVLNMQYINIANLIIKEKINFL